MIFTKDDLITKPNPRTVLALIAISFVWFLPIFIISIGISIFFEIYIPAWPILLSPVVLGYLTLIECNKKNRIKQDKEKSEVT